MIYDIKIKSNIIAVKYVDNADDADIVLGLIQDVFGHLSTEQLNKVGNDIYIIDFIENVIYISKRWESYNTDYVIHIKKVDGLNDLTAIDWTLYETSNDASSSLTELASDKFLMLT